MLAEGSAAPDFTLPTGDGEQVSLSGLRGKKVILYFYPKDDTPGCTKEACGFRDNHDAILAKGAVVIGISGDSEASHQKFKDKYQLPFYLLADPEKKVIEQYQAWGEKKMYGKIFPGTLRVTYVIDEHGTIVKAFSKVKADEHASEVLPYL